MARKTLPLSDTEIKQAKSKEKAYCLFDGLGLYIQIMPPGKPIEGKTLPGSKLWRFKYRFAGKEKLISFGSYPEVSLAAARKKRDDTRQMIKDGIDPVCEKKTKRAECQALAAGIPAENSFEAVTREWHGELVEADHWDKDHAASKLHKLEKDIFPWLGRRPIDQITPPELLESLRRVQKRGALEAAHRLLYDCTKIWTHAIATGKATYNSALQLKGILPPIKKGNHAALIEPKAVALLLRAIEDYQGSLVVRTALKLAPMLYVRPGELRHMEWDEIDFDANLWNIPGHKMKLKKPHIVPLARQAVEALKELQPLTGGGKYVFPGARGPGRPMSENAVNVALKAMGYDNDTMVGHGFRATARTMGRERLKFDTELLEIQLAHLTKAPNGTAYDRVAFIDERCVMMQRWADYLDELKVS